MQPGSWAHITDTAVVRAQPCVLHRVAVGTGAAEETLELHDAAAADDADSSTLVSTIPLDDAGSHDFGVQLGRGLVAVVSGGSPDITIVWG